MTLLKFFLSFLLLTTISFCTAQCLTDFKKLIPDQTPVYSESFGYSVGIYDGILVVGAPKSDTLGFQSAGAVYLYQRSAGSWQSIGILKPSAPKAQLQFGHSVKITKDYILVNCGSVDAGLYIFRKPATGWTTASESVLLNPDASSNFGSYFDLSEDQQTLVVTDITYPSSNGAFFVFHKQPSDEWNNNLVPQVVTNPDKDNNVTFFGIGGIKILGDRIACGTVSQFSGQNGSVYVFHDASGNYSAFQLEAKLTENSGSTGSYGPTFEFSAQGVFKYISGKVLYYETPVSGIWESNIAPCEFVINPVDGIEIDPFYVNYKMEQEKLYMTVKLKDNSGRVLVYQKEGNTWCDGVSRQIIYMEPPPAPNGSIMFVRSLDAYNGTEIASSWVSSVDSQSPVSVAVGIFSIQPNNLWIKQSVVKYKLSAENFRMGISVWHTGDFLFTTARNERLLDQQPRGVVYIFIKEAGLWNKVNKLSVPPVTSDDRNFGTAITGFENYVAISGFGYNPGKIFIYKGVNEDFASPVLLQTLQIPSGKFIDSYGNLAMNKDWIVVSIGTNNQSVGPRISLLFYKKESNEQWAYSHEVPLGPMTIFFKLPPTIDIEGNTLIASNGYNKVFILEYTEASLWQNKYTLAASDPDQDPFIGSLKVDGSFFGRSLTIDGDKIFVGAPGKNSGSMLDVGAIYVYTRPVNGTWTSGVETRKLTPQNLEAETFFGSAINVFNNTLVAGAAGSTNAGKVFVVQSKDYYWTNTIPLLTLSGDTFTPDGFGATVALDEDDFFIGAPLETNAAGVSAGALYVVQAPPIVRLEPPVCNSAESINLLGYPFWGTWSGPGIINEATGAFSPIAAGVGVHEILFTTPNCFYKGQLHIEVKSSPAALPLTTLEHTICNKEGKTSIEIGLVAETDVSYLWFFRQNTTDPHSSLSFTTNKAVVDNSKPGLYKVDASNSNCTISREFDIGVESDIPIEIMPIAEICDEKISQILLEAAPIGGTWALPDKPELINGDKLSITSLRDGTYKIYYAYTSPAQCIYRATTNVVIDLLRQPVVEYSGSLCEGAVTLSSNNIDNTSAIQWFNAEDPLQLATTPEFQTTLSGYYFVIASKYGCSLASEPIFIPQTRDSLFIPNVFTPNGDSFNDHFQIKSENLNKFNLNIMNRYGQSVFQTIDPSFKWSAENIAAGVYFWRITYLTCAARLKEHKGWIQVLK